MRKQFPMPFGTYYDCYCAVGEMDKSEANAKYQPKRSQKIKNKRRKGKKGKRK